MDNNMELMSSIKLRTAEALSPLLKLFCEIDGALLREVRQTVENEMVIAVTLQFDSIFLSIRAVEDDDTVDISLMKGHVQGDLLNDQQPWADKIGKPMGWNWVMVNQQGYLDGVLLSFGGVSPEIVITAVGSELKVRKAV
jgi:hypothetical protein